MTRREKTEAEYRPTAETLADLNPQYIYISLFTFFMEFQQYAYIIIYLYNIIYIL